MRPIYGQSLSGPQPPTGAGCQLDARNAAYAHWRETGDPTEINKFGFNLPDRRGSDGRMDVMPAQDPLIITEATLVEELISAHHDGRPIKFLDDTADFYCPGCGALMEAME